MSRATRKAQFKNSRLLFVLSSLLSHSMSASLVAEMDMDAVGTSAGKTGEAERERDIENEDERKYGLEGNEGDKGEIQSRGVCCIFVVHQGHLRENMGKGRVKRLADTL